MPKTVITVYTDYKSPYAFVAKQSTYDIQRDYDVELDWLPYTLDIPDYLGSTEERSAHQWRKVRYAYMDARRLANKQGLTLKGPKRVYNAYYANVGLLFAKQHGFFRQYNDTVFEKFWRHELNVDLIDDIASVISALGFDAQSYRSYAEGPGRREHQAIRDEAEATGVFGVPTFVLDDELFWGGDRFSDLAERLQERDLAKPGRVPE